MTTIRAGDSMLDPVLQRDHNSFSSSASSSRASTPRAPAGGSSSALGLPAHAAATSRARTGARVAIPPGHDELLQKLKLPPLYYIEADVHKVAAWEFERAFHIGPEHMEAQIEDYERAAKLVSETLSEKVLHHYHAFSTGINLVHAVSTEMTRIEVLVKNSRRKLQFSREGLKLTSDVIIAKERKRKKIETVLGVLQRFAEFLKWTEEIGKCFQSDCGAGRRDRDHEWDGAEGAKADYLGAVRALRELERSLARTASSPVLGGDSGAGSVQLLLHREDHDEPDFASRFSCVADARKRLGEKKAFVQGKILDGLRTVLLRRGRFAAPEYEKILLAAAESHDNVLAQRKNSTHSSLACSTSGSGSASSSKEGAGNLNPTAGSGAAINLLGHRTATGAAAAQLGGAPPADPAFSEPSTSRASSRSTSTTRASVLGANDHAPTRHTSSPTSVSPATMVSEVFLDAVVSVANRTQNRFKRAGEDEVDRSCYVLCLSHLLEEFVELLYRWKHDVCGWHRTKLLECSKEEREDAPEGRRGSKSAEELLLCHDVLEELLEGQRALWDKMQYQLSLLLLSWHFDEHLRENEFYHCVFLLLLFAEEGDHFFAPVEGADERNHKPKLPPGARTANARANPQSHSTPTKSLRNTLKTLSHHWIEAIFRNGWLSTHQFLSQESWQRIPIISAGENENTTGFSMVDKRFSILQTLADVGSNLTFAQSKRLLHFEMVGRTSTTTTSSSSNTRISKMELIGEEWARANLFTNYDPSVNLCRNRSVGEEERRAGAVSGINCTNDFSTSTSSSDEEGVNVNSAAPEVSKTQRKVANLLEHGAVLATSTVQVSQHVMLKLIRALSYLDVLAAVDGLSATGGHQGVQTQPSGGRTGPDALASEVQTYIAQLFEYYLYLACCASLSKHDLKCYLGKVDLLGSFQSATASAAASSAPATSGQQHLADSGQLHQIEQSKSAVAPVQWPKVFAKYRNFLLQSLGPRLRERLLHVQDYIIENENFAAADVNLLDMTACGCSTSTASTSTSSRLSGLAERAVAVESCFGLLRTVAKTLSTFGNGRSGNGMREFLEQAEKCCEELRQVVYYCAARDLLYLSQDSAITLDTFCSEVLALANDVPPNDGSTRIYFDQMTLQLQDLSRRIPCCGGGSLPHFVQKKIWCGVEYHFLLACTDALARAEAGRGRAWLAEGFLALRSRIREARDRQTAKAATLLNKITRGGEEQASPKACARQRDSSNVGNLDAHGRELTKTVWRELVGREVMAQLNGTGKSCESSEEEGSSSDGGFLDVEFEEWSRAHKEYPLELHVNLLKSGGGKSVAVMQELLTELCIMAQSELESRSSNPM
eukprot:g453.t1